MITVGWQLRGGQMRGKRTMGGDMNQETVVIVLNGPLALSPGRPDSLRL